MGKGNELDAVSQRPNASFFVLPESLKIGFLNTLKETPGTYPSPVPEGLASKLVGECKLHYGGNEVLMLRLC